MRKWREGENERDQAVREDQSPLPATPGSATKAVHTDLHQEYRVHSGLPMPFLPGQVAGDATLKVK